MAEAQPGHPRPTVPRARGAKTEPLLTASPPPLARGCAARFRVARGRGREPAFERVLQLIDAPPVVLGPSTSFFKVLVFAQSEPPPEAAPSLVIRHKADRGLRGPCPTSVFRGQNSRWFVLRVYQCEVPHYVWRRTPYLGVSSVDEPSPPDALLPRPAGVCHEMMGPVAGRITPT